MGATEGKTRRALNAIKDGDKCEALPAVAKIIGTLSVYRWREIRCAPAWCVPYFFGEDMTDNEILREYRTAKNPKNQIKIMAELYPSIGERGIYEALIRCGEKIEIPKRLLKKEEQMEELKITEVKAETTTEEKVDRRKAPWSEERKAAQSEAIREAYAKRKALKGDGEVKDWKPINFDKPAKELPVEVQYIVIEGLKAIIKESKEKFAEAKALMNKYNECVKSLSELGMAFDKQEVED